MGRNDAYRVNSWEGMIPRVNSWEGMIPRVKAVLYHFHAISSDSHNPFLLPPMNLIYGSKDSSLQELYNEL